MSIGKGITPLGNGLRMVLKRIDNSAQLQGSMLAFWGITNRFTETDSVVSAVYETLERGYGVSETRDISVEYKLSFITQATASFTGVDFDKYLIGDSDIIAQLRWNKSKDNLGLNVVSPHNPTCYMQDYMFRSGIGSTPTLMQLYDLVGVLYTKGWRICLHDPFHNGSTFLLHLLKDDIVVKVQVYTHDYQNAHALFAHLNY